MFSTPILPCSQETVKINNEAIKIIQVKLKSPKTDRIGVDTIVDVYGSFGPLCPVKILLKWQAVASHRTNNSPVFRDEQGKPLTGVRFNKYLKTYLGKYLDHKVWKITSHSFRAGMASLLGTLGFTDEEIQAVGR